MTPKGVGSCQLEMTFHWIITSSDEIESVAGFLGLASQAVKEGHVGEQTVLILRVADLSEHLLLLFSQLLAHGLDLVLKGVHGAIEVCGDLEGFLVLSPCCIGLLLQHPELLLWVRQADGSPGLLDQNKPTPVPAGEVLAEVPLANLDQLPLVVLLLVDVPTHPLQHLALNE